MKTGVRQHELGGLLRQHVVAVELLVWGRLWRRHAHCIHQHFLVVKPHRWRVVDVLVAGVELNKSGKQNKSTSHKLPSNQSVKKVNF